MPTPAPGTLLTALTGLSLLLAGQPATADVCLPPDGDTFMALTLSRQERAALTPGTGSTSRRVVDSQVQLRLNDHWTTGFRHRYTDLNIDGLDLQTNGHLHNVVVPLHWQREDKGVRISIAPALSASSNLVAEPGDYDADLLQLLAAIDWRQRISNELALRYGLCADHRFGAWRIYPVLAVDWRPGERWRIELGLPDTRIRYEVSDRLALRVSAGPAGNQWHVRDRDTPAESELRYEAKAIAVGVSIRPVRRLTVNASIGRHVDSVIEGVLRDGDPVRVRKASSTGVEAEVAWRFR